MATPFSNSEPVDEETITLRGPRRSSRLSDALLTYNRRTGCFKVDNGTIIRTAKMVTVETQHGTYNVIRYSNGEYTTAQI